MGGTNGEYGGGELGFGNKDGEKEIRD